MTRDEAIAMLDARDPIAAAAGITPVGEITWSRGTADEGAEVVRYGVDTTSGQVVDRLLEIAGRDDVRAVALVPGDDTPERPGSWGVDDLLVTAVARHVLPAHVAIRNDWHRIGGPACQAGIAFGATEWRVPVGDPACLDGLAHALGATAVEA